MIEPIQPEMADGARRVSVIIILLCVGVVFGAWVSFSGTPPLEAETTAPPPEATRPAPAPGPVAATTVAPPRPAPEPLCEQACDPAKLIEATSRLTLRRTFALGTRRADIDGRVVTVGETFVTDGVPVTLTEITPMTATLSAEVWTDQHSTRCHETTVTLAR